MLKKKQKKVVQIIEKIETNGKVFGELHDATNVSVLWHFCRTQDAFHTSYPSSTTFWMSFSDNLSHFICLHHFECTNVAQTQTCNFFSATISDLVPEFFSLSIAPPRPQFYSSDNKAPPICETSFIQKIWRQAFQTPGNDDIAGSLDCSANEAGLLFWTRTTADVYTARIKARYALLSECLLLLWQHSKTQMVEWQLVNLNRLLCKTEEHNSVPMKMNVKHNEL